MVAAGRVVPLDLPVPGIGGRHHWLGVLAAVQLDLATGMSGGLDEVAVALLGGLGGRAQEFADALPGQAFAAGGRDGGGLISRREVGGR